MSIHLFAVFAAAVAAWMFGAAWYGLLGKHWQAALDKTPEGLLKHDPEKLHDFSDKIMSRNNALDQDSDSISGNPARGAKKMPVGPMVTSFVAEILMAFVMAGLIAHFGTSLEIGVIVGGLSWLGFIAPTIVTNNAYAGRKPILSIIDVGHWLGVLMIQGIVIGAFG
jgi:hypothetical protein